MTAPDELERLARAATPGPWVWTPRVLQGAAQYAGYGDMGGFVTPNGFPVCWFGDNETYYPTEGTPPSDTDAAFIAAANPATILALLSERAELLDTVERMRGAMVRLLDAEFARDWRTWSDKRTHLLLGIGPRKDAFVEARAALTTGEG